MSAGGPAADNDLLRINAQLSRMSADIPYRAARILDAVINTDARLGIMQAILDADADEPLLRIMIRKGKHPLRIPAGPATAVDGDEAGAFVCGLMPGRLENVQKELLVPCPLIHQRKGGSQLGRHLVNRVRFFDFGLGAEAGCRQGGENEEAWEKGHGWWMKRGNRWQVCDKICPRSRAGVGGVVNLLHALGGDVGIDLRGAETGMAEQLLHAAEIRPVI